MTDEEFNPWATSSGLYDDVDVEITDAYFEWDSEYDRLMLKLDITTDDPDNATDTLNLGCGTGWEAAEKGAKAQRENGKNTPFNGNSGVGLWCDAMIEAGALEVLMRRGDPRTADAWKGLKFHCERRVIKGGDGFKDRTPLLPTKFLGEVGKGQGKKVEEKAEVAEEAEEAKGVKAEAADDGAAEAAIPGKLKVALLKLAKEHTDHDDFLMAAFEIDGVDGNAAAETAIADPGSGIWAQVHGGG